MTFMGAINVLCSSIRSLHTQTAPLLVDSAPTPSPFAVCCFVAICPLNISWAVVFLKNQIRGELVEIYNSHPHHLSRRAAVECASSSYFRLQLQNKRASNGSAQCLCLLIYPCVFLCSSVLFLCYMQLFVLTVVGPTTVIKHQLAHLQSCINEAQQPTAGAKACNHPAALQHHNGWTMNCYLLIQGGATSFELRDFQHSVDLLTSSQAVEAMLPTRQISSLILSLLCGWTFISLVGHN